jgi:aspartyl-tRNA(Asn)/glutamyl-tRNA(Gln) amidotransferase subunit C
VLSRLFLPFLLILNTEINMSLTADDVNKIAHLARLGIDSQDIKSYAKDLSGMLDLMTQMSELNTDNVEPMAHPMDQAQRLRTDVVTEQNNREKFQAIAPQVDTGLYLVPKVIE